MVFDVFPSHLHPATRTLASYLSILLTKNGTSIYNHKVLILMLSKQLKHPQTGYKYMMFFFFTFTLNTRHNLITQTFVFNCVCGFDIDLTSIHQVSHSIFSCWAEDEPWLREREALQRGKTHTNVTLGCVGVCMWNKSRPKRKCCKREDERVELRQRETVGR